MATLVGFIFAPLVALCNLLGFRSCLRKLSSWERMIKRSSVLAPAVVLAVAVAGVVALVPVLPAGIKARLSPLRAKLLGLFSKVRSMLGLGSPQLAASAVQ